MCQKQVYCQIVFEQCNHNSIMVLRATPKEVAVWSSLQAMSFDDSKEYPTWLFFCYPVAIKRGNKVYKIIIIKLAKHCRCLRTKTYINKCYDHSRYVWCIQSRKINSVSNTCRFSLNFSVSLRLFLVVRWACEC